MKRLTLAAIAVAMLAGTAVNVGCGFVSGSNCGDAYFENMQRVESGTYEVQIVEQQNSAMYETALFADAQEVEIDIPRDGFAPLSVTFAYDGAQERWTTERPQ